MGAPQKHLGPLVCKSGEIVFSHQAPLLATLGSCVGVIVHDRRSGLYGINHYLLPDPKASSRNSELGDLEFGSLSIPAMFRKMKELGSQKQDLDLWVMGGARQFQSASEVGRMNIEIAQLKLRELDLVVLDFHVGGHLGRRVEVNIVKGTISVWLLNGIKTRMDPDAIFEIPT